MSRELPLVDVRSYAPGHDAAGAVRERLSDRCSYSDPLTHVRLGVTSAASLRRNRRLGYVLVTALAVALPGVDPFTTALEIVPLAVLFLALYRSHPEKPYGFGEYGLWGVDRPAFIRKMASFIREHKRVEFAVYYESARGSVFDLGNKPGGRAAYRDYITPLGN